MYQVVKYDDWTEEELVSDIEMEDYYDDIRS